MSLLAAAIGAKVVGGLVGARGARKSGKQSIALAGQQEQMAYENRQLELKELEEGIRRTELQNRMIRGSAKARAAGSGLSEGGSLTEYLGFMESNQSEEVEWMREAGESRADLNLEAGLLQAQGTRIGGQAQKRQGIGSLFSAAGDVFSFFG